MADAPERDKILPDAAAEQAREIVDRYRDPQGFLTHAECDELEAAIAAALRAAKNV